MVDTKSKIEKQDEITLHPEALLPPLCRIAHVLTVVPIARSTVWAWVAQKRFPAPIKYGAITLWKREDVLAWLQKAREVA
jgi:predicted DNA-binding transcriptional regulator AlpA